MGRATAAPLEEALQGLVRNLGQLFLSRDLGPMPWAPALGDGQTLKCTGTQCRVSSGRGHSRVMACDKVPTVHRR